MYNLILGNSAEKLKDLDSESIDLVVCSPPYDEIREYNGVIDSWNFDTFTKIAKELGRVVKPGGVVVWIVADMIADFKYSMSSFKQAIYFCDNCGFGMTDNVLYEKAGNFKTNYGRYTQIYENGFVFSKGRPKTFNPIKDVEKKEFSAPKVKTKMQRNYDGSPKYTKFMYPGTFWAQRTNIWKYAPGAEPKGQEYTKEHSARFPELLAHDHIISWSNEGDTVLDPFCGSGTTGKMALLNKRNFIGIEMDEKFYAISKRRLEEAEETQGMALDG